MPGPERQPRRPRHGAPPRDASGDPRAGAAGSTERLDLDFVIIGAQKSASTFLQVCLAQHPSIAVPAGESRHFEDPWYDAGGVAALREELLAELGPPAAGRVVGIKRPDYLARPAVAARLAQWVPDARLLVVLREPVSRAVSAYFDYVRMGFLPLQPLDRGMRQVLSGELESAWPRATDVLDYGLYGRHLTRFAQHFPAEQLLVLLQAELREDPVGQVRSAFAFLGVDTTFVPQLPAGTNRGVHNALRLRLLRSRNRLLFDYEADRSRRVPRPPSPVRGLWPAVATGLDRTLLARLDRSPVPALPPSLREALEEYYAADTNLLAAVLGRPVPWARPASPTVDQDT